MKLDQVVASLKNDLTPYRDINSFSSLSGIYAFSFIGNKFPLALNNLKCSDIIYIGKTETSQLERDKKTHFSSGKTGSSTLRKTLGALLKNELGLQAIPRNQIDYFKGRISHFKFDVSGEEKLTNWMVNNLALSFFEYPKPKVEIQHLEQLLIEHLIPPLNLSKNTNNPFLTEIKLKRKACCAEAFNLNSTLNFNSSSSRSSLKDYNPVTLSHSHKYENFWLDILPIIKESLRTGTPLATQLSKTAFDSVGKRKSYAFNLFLNRQAVANNIKGSAVARDLARIILNDDEALFLLMGKHVKIGLDKNFILYVQF